METTSDGIRIHFEVRGAGAPVLLVHGYPLSGALWDDVVPHLESDFRLIVPDLRGHGRSDAGDSASMDELADDLVAVLEEIAGRFRKASGRAKSTTAPVTSSPATGQTEQA